jgi:hypothetical protein
MVTRMGGTLQNERLSRMCLRLQNFSFNVTHRKGKDHWDADAISRLLRVGEVAWEREPDLCTDTEPLTASERKTLRSMSLHNDQARDEQLVRDKANVVRYFGAKAELPEYVDLISKTLRILDQHDEELCSEQHERESYLASLQPADHDIILNTIRCMSYEEETAYLYPSQVRRSTQGSGRYAAYP